jgi:hypothetical protein
MKRKTNFMTTNLEINSRGLPLVPTRPLTKIAPILPDFMSGGYSVWACPPQRECKLPASAQKVP